MKRSFLIVMLLGPLSAFAQAKSSTLMNPNIGANMLFGGAKSTSGVGDGFSFPEAEFSFKSDVDPYFTANMIFALENDGGVYSISPEEVYGETTALPAVTVKVGKFYGAFGKQNILHTHIFPFIDRPLISSELLGEGLNAAGASASVLLPLPFFSEFTAQGFGNFVSLARWRNLFELGEAATLEAGVSAVNRWAYGVDLTFKHRPTDRGQGRRFNLAGEWMAGSLEGFTVTPTSDGLPTRGFDVYAQYEFIPRFYFQYRFDDLISNSTLRHGLLLGYAPSEFTVMRIQTDHASTSGAGIENRVLIQVSYTIGFHPSHDY